MALLKNKKKDAAPEETVKVAAKKAKNRLHSLLRESVPENVLETFRNNEPFVTTRDGKPAYVGILLNMDDIGGLDKKSSNKDEAKGTFVSFINGGSIATMITPELLDENSIVIIPMMDTLVKMDELSMLTDAPYEFVYVDDDYVLTKTGIKTSFKDLSNLVENDGHVNELLGIDDADDELDVSLEDDDDVEDAVTEDDDDDIPDIDSDAVMGAESLEEAPAAQAAAPAQTAYEESVPEQVYSQAPAEAAPQVQEQPVMQEAYQEAEESVPEDFTEEAIIRRYYSDDLGLEVSTEPFDAQFMHNNTYVPFDENRPESWLNNQVNERAKLANDEMARIHQNNLFLMRERYFKLLSMQVDRIQTELDVNNKDTQYGQLKKSYDDYKASQMRDKEQVISDRKLEIDRRWNDRLDEVGREAADAAKRQYKERYHDRHESELFAIDGLVHAEVNDDYQEKIHEMNERRRMEASKMLDLSITEVLDEISEMYESAIADENVRYNELAEGIEMFIDEHRKQDVARYEAMAEENRQREKADAVLAEQTAKMRQMNEEYTRRKKELTDDIARIQRENAARIEDLKAENQEKLDRAKREKDDTQQQLDTLFERYQNLDEAKNKEYQIRMNEIRDEASSWEEKCNHVIEVHKRSNLLSVFIVIAVMIVSLAIGFIGGEYVNINRKSQQKQAQMIEEFNNSRNAQGAEEADE